MTDHFAESSASFTDWFKASQPSLNPKIQLADLRHLGKGRGIIAVQDLAQDEELFSVSRDRILSTENSDFAKTPRGQELITNLDDQWLSLILVMIRESLMNEGSVWKPYFDVLPESFDTLMFWTEDELAELQASSVRDKIGKTSADRMFTQDLLPTIRSAPSHFPGVESLTDQDLLCLAHRMGSTIMAYAFDIEKRPSTQAQDEEGYVSDDEADFLPKGMIPMADMLNADAALNNARLFYEADTVSMRTLVPVKAGDELFNDYGPLPRADLLRRYGYITENYAAYDVVEIATDLVVTVVKGLKSTQQASLMTDAYLSEVADALSERGYHEDAYDLACHSHSPDDDDESEPDDKPLFPPGLQMLLYRLVVDNNDSPPPKKYAKKPAALSDEERHAIANAYIAVLRARQAEYSTSIEQDRRILADLTPPQASSRKGVAIQVRLGEKLVLQRALEHVWASGITQSNGITGEEPSSKRLKTSNGI
ncbi:hypothetical protein ANO11243_047360 [Dothideomycetidae sp. 11243]|nr:hypothetical protein ANO11243_047360 [fungal sp. No.11243]